MSQALRVLIVEDSEDDAQLVIRELRKGNYDPVCQRVQTPEEMKQALEKFSWDIVISDYSMPHFNGLSALYLLRQRWLDIPFILISGTIGEEIAVEAMKAGAHDYLMKGNLHRLVPAVQRELQEAEVRKAHRKAENALKESEERFRSMAEHIQAVFFITDAKAERFEYISPAYKEIWGKELETLYRSPYDWVESVHPEDRDAVAKALSQISRVTFDMEHRIIRPDGVLRWIHARAFPVRDEYGNISRIVGIAEDITAGKKLEEQFQQSQKMEAVGQLAGGIAHDFNNLLTLMIGYSEEILQEINPDHPFYKEVQGIRRAAERAAGLTRQLLAFSRRQILQPKILSLNNIVQDAEKMLKRLIGEHIELHTNLDASLKAVKVDPGQVEQVLMNLAVNARDAMPKGGELNITTANVELDDEFVWNHPGLEKGPFVMLEVSDSGCGMDAELQKRIFEPFFTTKEKGKGTGLGLSTVYGIVNQSKGQITVESQPNRGTTFKVYLPQAEGVGKSAGRVHVVPEMPQGSETVLLVEDEEEVRTLASKVLQGQGYKVLEASNGVEALTACQEHSGPINLLLTDIVMPKMGGLELAKQLEHLKPEIKLLFMSGYTDDTAVHQRLLTPDALFLQKPFTPHILACKVREALEKSE